MLERDDESGQRSEGKSDTIRWLLAAPEDRTLPDGRLHSSFNVQRRSIEASSLPSLSEPKLAAVTALVASSSTSTERQPLLPRPPPLLPASQTLLLLRNGTTSAVFRSAESATRCVSNEDALKPEVYCSQIS